MIDGLRAVWRGLRHLNQAGYIYVWCSVAWALLSLPIVTAPAAWAGLIRLSWTAQRQPTAGWDDFWAGFRAHLLRGAILAVCNLAFWLVWLSNWAAYGAQPGVEWSLLRGLWLLTGASVILIQVYGGVLYHAMTRPTVIGAFRNGAVMLVRNPLFSLGVLIGFAAIIALSTLLPLAWLLITGGALAAVSVRAVIDRLQRAGILSQEEPESYLVDPSFSDM
jgi:hypothetical protein